MNDLFKRVSVWWSRVREIYHVLELIRFSLLLGAVGVVMMFIGQGQEALLSLAETGDSLSKGFVLWLTAVLCGISVWYCARTMYRFDFASNPLVVEIIP